MATTATVMITLSGSRSPGKNDVMVVVNKVAVRPMTGSWDTYLLKCGKPSWWAKDT